VAFVCPNCAHQADVRSESCASTFQHPVTAITSSPSEMAVRLYLNQPASDLPRRDTLRNLAQEQDWRMLQNQVQEQQHLLSRTQAENEALRQQIADHQGSYFDAPFISILEDTVAGLRSSRGAMSSAVQLGFKRPLRIAWTWMLFQHANFAGTGALLFSEAKTLYQRLMAEELEESKFVHLCKGTSTLSLKQFQRLYKWSGRSAEGDLRNLLCFGEEWRINWMKLVETVLGRIDKRAGGRQTAYSETLFPLPGCWISFSANWTA